MKSQGSIKSQKQTYKSEKGKTYNKLESNYDDQQYMDTGIDNNDYDLIESSQKNEQKIKLGKRNHEIYDKTYYIPNDKLRLLEIPMNSSLVFQMLLYYHSYYDILYGVILIPTGVYKLMVGDINIMIILSLVFTIFYCITEFFRLNFGYKGNINESFSELIAFSIQTLLFSLAFVVIPLISTSKFAHEDCMYIMNIVFLASELIIGQFVMIKFSNTQSAAFYRRTAPLIDKKFKRKYEQSTDFRPAGPNSKRETQIGMRRVVKAQDASKIFEESDHKININF